MNRNLHSLLLFLALNAFLPLTNAQNPGCDGSRFKENLFTGVSKTTTTYAVTTGQLGNSINLAIDIYTPQGDSLLQRPVVILAHGGSFILGDKSMMQSHCELLARKGYVAASIQYRLFPFLVLGYPDSFDVMDTAIKAVADMKAAVRFFRLSADNGNPHRIDPENIFIGGYSAGAVTALHAGYLDSLDVLPPFIAALLDANGGLVGNSGNAANQSYSSQAKAVLNMSGGLYRSFWIDADDLPLTSIHGTNDQTVDYEYGLAAGLAYLEGSALIHAQAETAGLFHQLVTVPGGGHTNVYDQPQYQIWRDSFWRLATTTMESLVCAATPLDVATAPAAAEKWQISPNPFGTDGNPRVYFPADMTLGDIQVFDARGRLAASVSALSAGSRLDLAALPAGVYWLRLQDPATKGRVFEWKMAIKQ